MARLFIFAVGGTGSRVLKSLTMLLASGIKPKSDKEYEIIPIIIDPHSSNDDKKRTETLIENYQLITDEIGIDNGFFGTRISTLKKIIRSKNRLSNNFSFNLQEVSGQKFHQYIGFNELDLNKPKDAPKANQALADLLFSGNSINKRGEEVPLLDIEMDIGFVGNPNIGSIVLNQFKDSDEYKEVASNFNADDRIFIISSIFGGTGAAGFPVILKNLRDARNNPNIDGRGFLENSMIGALTVMPYFNIEKDSKSPIQKSDFIAKTKAALYYYKQNVTGNNSVNALYYIADDYSGKPYKNDPGDNGQQNDAHFVELAAALSIIDFLEVPDRELICENGKAIKPIYKEFGIRNNSENIKFSDLEDKTGNRISLGLSQLTMFKKFIDERFATSAGVHPWSVDKPEIDKNSITNTYTEFFTSYKDWLDEMANNRRGFSPFNYNSSIESLVEGKTGKYGFWKSKANYSFIDESLSKQSKGKSYKSTNQKLIKLFFDTTNKILSKSYDLKN
jgi:hypothetical protein